MQYRITQLSQLTGLLPAYLLIGQRSFDLARIGAVNGLHIGPDCHFSRIDQRTEQGS